MKQAKQQAQDLNQTSEFLNSLIAKDGSEKHHIKASPANSHSGRLANGRPKVPKVDAMARFSDPPAPPPQQPLPEKPQAPSRSMTSDSIAPSSLKRSDTEKTKVSASSPSGSESSQILSLLDALASTKKELDAQGTRVKELEDLLNRERTARETAEERARSLEDRPVNHTTGSEVEAAFEPPREANEDTAWGNSTEAELDENTSSLSTDTALPQKPHITSSDTASEQLQLRLDGVLAEMEEMKKQMHKHKDAAERAENDATEARKTLAEMVETLRQERSQKPSSLPQESSEVGFGEEHTSERDSLADQKVIAQSVPSAATKEPTSRISHTQVKELEGAATAFAKQRHKHHMLEQSAPYASMLGVVLLGVGIMTYLNGWQKLDK